MPKPRLLFAPGLSGHGRTWRSALEQIADVLFVAQTAEELRGGALPGSRTLFTPRYPVLIDEALRLCDGVVTGSREFADRAKRSGAPVVFLDGPEIPELPKAGRVVRQEVIARETTLEICAAADHRYLPFLVGFLANLRRFDFPLEHVHLLALDKKMEREVRARYPRLTLHRPSDLWDETEWRTVSDPARGPGGRAFSSKPRLLRHVLRQTGRPVFYSDLDIFYYHSPENLAEAIGAAPALLFPQWNDQLWHSKFYGVFNAGMVAVQSGAEPFLHWWSEHCLHHYNANMLHGYYADQGFLDLAPVHFPEVRAYREGDHNVAYWNIGTLVESFRPGVDDSPRLRSGRPLQSFHAAVPDALGLYEWKAGWDQVHAFFADLPPECGEVLEESAVQQQAEHWLAVSRLRKLQQTLWPSLRIWDPRVGRAALYSPLSYLLRGVARLHYQIGRLRRALWSDSDSAAINRSHLTLLRPSDDRRPL